MDGFKNEKLQTIKFQKFSIDCAHFTIDGKQFIAGSRTQRNFYCYDLMEGRSTFIPVHHNIGQTKMDVCNSFFLLLDLLLLTYFNFNRIFICHLMVN